MAGEDLDAVGQLEQPAQRVEEPLGALLRVDGEVGPPRVADEERVAGEHEPRLVGARAVDDREARVLRPVAGRVDRAQDDLAELELGAVLERVVRVLGLGGGMDRDRHAVLERQPAVAREVVGVGVRLDDAHDADAAPLGLAQERLDAYGGSTTAATPASSSPTRYDAQPRSSSRNCWKSTAGDATTERSTAIQADSARFRTARTRRASLRSRPRQTCKGHRFTGLGPVYAARMRLVRSTRAAAPMDTTEGHPT